MTWSANLGGHLDSAEDELYVRDVLADAAGKIGERIGDRFSCSFYGQHTGQSGLKEPPKPGDVSTADEPLPPAPPPTPGGPGTGSGGK